MLLVLDFSTIKIHQDQISITAINYEVHGIQEKNLMCLLFGQLTGIRARYGTGHILVYLTKTKSLCRFKCLPLNGINSALNQTREEFVQSIYYNPSTESRGAGGISMQGRMFAQASPGFSQGYTESSQRRNSLSNQAHFKLNPMPTLLPPPSWRDT
ncbi:hypothetical protein C5167_013945 [Papaver somniferum]|uniref:Uncharacterized protein n=1 Tax=Papaver somniferum TaxID=3469 RepID=A0A4Y7J1S1_PAPSO|nr:hypothetical protein C5167_013945 [Papaver somniferum]